MRPSGRANDELRQIRFTRQFTKHAAGSVLVEFGDTKGDMHRISPRTRCQVSYAVAARMGNSRIRNASRATNSRNDREAARGKQSGRTMEINGLLADHCAQWSI